jgi:diguanylate cyclase (GGDEF)-like protein/PAS domain S-box-containing protein
MRESTGEIENERLIESITQSNPLYQALFEHYPEPVCLMGLDGVFVRINKPWEETSGYDREASLQMPFERLIYSTEIERVGAYFRKVVHGEPQSYDTTILREDGKSVELGVVMVPIITEGKVVGVLGIAKDITEQKRVRDPFNSSALHDILTGLPGRWLFKNQLTKAIEETGKDTCKLAIMTVDINRFKNINDSFGYQCGDLLLKEVSTRLARVIDGDGTIARMSEDEFILLFPLVHDREQVILIAEKIAAEFNPSFHIESYEFQVTNSIGISLFPDDAADAEGLIRHASTALYYCKEQGSTYYFYSEEIEKEIYERFEMEKDLRKAIEQNEFIVHYQPQVNVKTGKIVGAEALLRWQHPGKGIISPLKFIPLAEETGLIIPIGEWVLRTACGQAKSWHEEGYSHMRVAVNISVRQFRQRNFIHRIVSILEETRLEPEFLELEITENICMSDIEYALQMIHDLKKLGITISIDDFGTGYSSLSYLSKFPIETLKIDRSFIQGIHREEGNAAIVNSIIELAQSLHLKVVAEGVETEIELDYLNKRGCEMVQGYYFSAPVATEMFTDLLRAQKE